VALKDELVSEDFYHIREKWDARDGLRVPADTSIKLSNDAVKISGAVLYADIADSTKMFKRDQTLLRLKSTKHFYVVLRALFSPKAELSPLTTVTE